MITTLTPTAPSKAWLEKTRRLRARLMFRGGCRLTLAELREWLDAQRVIGVGGVLQPFFRCAYCRVLVPEMQITADHDLPVALGGTATIENLKLCCERCNRVKGTLSGSGFLKLLEFLKLNLTIEDQGYMNRQLAMRPVFRSRTAR